MLCALASVTRFHKGIIRVLYECYKRVTRVFGTREEQTKTASKKRDWSEHTQRRV
jgi:hypothetical protein